jgi:hypothetical protein
VFLYHRSRDIYFRLRNTILVTWLLSVPCTRCFPWRRRASPTWASSTRSRAERGFAMDSNLTTSFYNELAAVPSLHVGFAVAVGIALAAALRHPLARSLALLWGPGDRLAVVVTGNHYVFDIVAASRSASRVGARHRPAAARHALERSGAVAAPDVRGHLSRRLAALRRRGGPARA